MTAAVFTEAGRVVQNPPHEFAKITAAIHLRPELDTYRLEQINGACAQKAYQLDHNPGLLSQA